MLGGIGGAVSMLALGILLSGTYDTQFLTNSQQQELSSIILRIAIATSCGEILGSWLALRWQKYTSRRTHCHVAGCVNPPRVAVLFCGKHLPGVDN